MKASLRPHMPERFGIDLPQHLAARLRHPLPGHTAQRRFEPDFAYGRHAGPAAENARRAAVLVLLYRQLGKWHIPLAVRPATMLLHAGQIALPGGSVDEGETSGAAARRELEEEFGVPVGDVELLGQLTPLYTYVTNFVVTPWIGLHNGLPQWHLSEAEVAELIELPLDALLNPALRGVHSRRHRGIALRAPHLAFGRHRIWGTTAMILGELIALLDELTNSAPRT